jgi:hypothetical protein
MTTANNFPKICGVLVEPRKLSNIHLLIENFHIVLPARTLFFFCGVSHYLYYTNFYINTPFIKIIPLKIDNLTAKEHNDLWKDINFWNHFTDFTHLLSIQTDGCLCINSSYKIEDFLHYDFIGGYTPFKWWWKETQGLHNYSDYQCFNGGFSFRNIQSMITVLKKFTPLPTQDFNEDLSFRSYGEDLYFVVGLLTLNAIDKQQSTNTSTKKIYNVGLDAFATKFCTHTNYLHNTFCVHKLDNYTKPQELSKFLEYCPLFIHFTKPINL